MVGRLGLRWRWAALSLPALRAEGSSQNPLVTTGDVVGVFTGGIRTSRMARPPRLILRAERYPGGVVASSSMTTLSSALEDVPETLELMEEIDSLRGRGVAPEKLMRRRCWTCAAAAVMGPGYGAGGLTDGNISLSGVVGVNDGRRVVLEGKGLLPVGAEVIVTLGGQRRRNYNR